MLNVITQINVYSHLLIESQSYPLFVQFGQSIFRNTKNQIFTEDDQVIYSWLWSMRGWKISLVNNVGGHNLILKRLEVDGAETLQ